MKRPCVGNLFRSLVCDYEGAFWHRSQVRHHRNCSSRSSLALVSSAHVTDTELHYSRSGHRTRGVDIHEGPRAFVHLSFPIRQMAVCQFRLSCIRAFCGSERPVLAWSCPGGRVAFVYDLLGRVCCCAHVHASAILGHHQQWCGCM